MSDLLTPEQAAEVAKARGVPVTERTIRRWATSGALRSVKLPGRVMIPADGLDELLKNGVPASEPEQGSAA